MNLYQDCLDAIGIAMLELKAGAPRLAKHTILRVVESLGSNREVESQELRVLALYSLSQVYGYLKQPEEAQKHGDEAGAQLKQIENPGKILDIEDRLADKLIELGEHRSAIPFCEQAIKLSGKGALQIANRLWRAARCYLRAGFKEQAEQPLRNALEIIREQKADPRTPVVLVDLGNALRRRSPREAESRYREAAAIWEREQKLGQASTAWVNLGLLCAEDGRVTEALEWYESARKVREADPTIAPAKLGPLYNNIANVYRRMSDFDGADRAVRQAMTLLESQGGASLASAYGTRGLIFRDQGADEEALEWFRKARAECEKQANPDFTDLIEKLENEAAMLKRLGRRTEAAAAENKMAQLRGIKPPQQTYDLGPLKMAKASTEGTVLIELDGATLPDSTYQNFDLATLEHRLAAAIEAEAAGELDGHEFGVTKTTVFLYGADAEELFRIIEPILRDYPLCEGACVLIRQAADERRVVINGNVADSGE